MIRIGTCSWTEKTLLKSGEFYPPDIKTSRDRLKFYSDHFNTVEVDSSYYAIPSEQNAMLWAERTPDQFTFHFKAFRYSYLYSDGELKEFAGSVRRLNRKAKKTYAMFNNCHGGFAVRNALSLNKLLAAPLE